MDEHEESRVFVDISWQDDGLCVGVGPEPFYLDQGGSSRPAKEICFRCPVREPCLEYALAHEDDHGIWGGLGREERRAILRERQQQHRAA